MDLVEFGVVVFSYPPIRVKENIPINLLECWDGLSLGSIQRTTLAEEDLVSLKADGLTRILATTFTLYSCAEMINRPRPDDVISVTLSSGQVALLPLPPKLTLEGKTFDLECQSPQTIIFFPTYTSSCQIINAATPYRLIFPRPPSIFFLCEDKNSGIHSQVYENRFPTNNEPTVPQYQPIVFNQSHSIFEKGIVEENLLTEDPKANGNGLKLCFTSENPMSLGGVSYREPIGLESHVTTWVGEVVVEATYCMELDLPETVLYKDGFFSLNQCPSSFNDLFLQEPSPIYPTPPSSPDFSNEDQALSHLLNSRGPFHRMIPITKHGYKIRHEKLKDPFCAFCKSNNETREICSSHQLRSPNGDLSCPILQSFVCPACGATGKGAHTIRYCPKFTYFKDRETANISYKFCRNAAGEKQILKL